MKKSTVIKEVFAKRLKELMEAKNETVYTLADLVHLSAATISRYSTGEMAPKITTIEALANYFDVNPVWLMGYEADRKAEKAAKKADEDIFTLAAHKVGHEGPLTDAEKEDIALAIKIALAKHKRQ